MHAALQLRSLDITTAADMPGDEPLHLHYFRGVDCADLFDLCVGADDPTRWSTDDVVGRRPDTGARDGVGRYPARRRDAQPRRVAALVRHERSGGPADAGRLRRRLEAAWHARIR